MDASPVITVRATLPSSTLNSVLFAKRTERQMTRVRPLRSKSSCRSKWMASLPKKKSNVSLTFRFPLKSHTLSGSIRPWTQTRCRCWQHFLAPSEASSCMCPMSLRLLSSTNSPRMRSRSLCRLCSHLCRSLPFSQSWLLRAGLLKSTTRLNYTRKPRNQCSQPLIPTWT